MSSHPHGLDLSTTATVLSVIRIHVLALPRGHRGPVGQKATQPFVVGSFDTGAGAGADCGGGEVQTVFWRACRLWQGVRVQSYGEGGLQLGVGVEMLGCRF